MIKQETIDQYNAEGIHLIAVKPNSKMPIVKSWTQGRGKITEVKELHEVFGIGIVCGALSGNLWAIDIDLKNDLTNNLYTRLCNIVKGLDPELFDSIRIHKTPSGGYHWLLRLPFEVPKSAKLASRPPTPEEISNGNIGWKALLETRGQGGFIVAQPTAGYTAINTLIPPMLTAEQYNLFIEACTSFDQKSPVEATAVTKHTKTKDSKFEVTPSDAFNEDESTAETILTLLYDAGWSEVGEDHERVYLLRPGETDSKSSGSFYKVKGLLKIFSSSTIFSPEQAYNKTHVYAMMKHRKRNGNVDWSACYKDLFDQGYGEKKTNLIPISTEVQGQDPSLIAIHCRLKGWTLEDSIRYQQEIYGISDTGIITAVFDMEESELKKQFKNTYGGGIHLLSHFIASEYEITFDEFKSQICVNGEILQDIHINSIWLNAAIKLAKLINVKKDMVSSIIHSDTIPVSNSLMTYIKENERRKEEGNLDKILSAFTLTHPDSIIFIKKWLIGLFALGLDGVQNRQVLVFSGPPNVGKTEFFRRLLPKGLSNLYADIKGFEEQLIEHKLSQHLILLYDEIEARSNRNNSILKRITSAVKFTVNVKFKANPVEFSRRAALCGATNESGILSDPTGNSRINICDIVDIDFDILNSVDRDELFMELYRRYKAGEEWQISKHEQETIVKMANSEHTLTDEIQEALEGLLIPVDLDTSDTTDKFGTIKIKKAEIMMLVCSYLSINKFSAKNYESVRQYFGTPSKQLRRNGERSSYYKARLTELCKRVMPLELRQTLEEAGYNLEASTKKYSPMDDDASTISLN